MTLRWAPSFRHKLHKWRRIAHFCTHTHTYIHTYTYIYINIHESTQNTKYTLACADTWMFPVAFRTKGDSDSFNTSNSPIGKPTTPLLFMRSINGTQILLPEQRFRLTRNSYDQGRPLLEHTPRGTLLAPSMSAKSVHTSTSPTKISPASMPKTGDEYLFATRHLGRMHTGQRPETKPSWRYLHDTTHLGCVHTREAPSDIPSLSFNSMET